MTNVKLKEIVKNREIRGLKLGYGRSALQKAGVNTIGEVIKLIDNKELESIAGIGSKRAEEIRINTEQLLLMWEKEINYFSTLPHDKEEWFMYLRLARAIYQIGEDEDFSQNSLDCSKIDEILLKLTFREEFVIRARYGLIDGEFWCLERLANKFNVTRERIRQIEFKALRKLRKFLGIGL